jgi:hypothetical protein
VQVYQAASYQARPVSVKRTVKHKVLSKNTVRWVQGESARTSYGAPARAQGIPLREGLQTLYKVRRAKTLRDLLIFVLSCTRAHGRVALVLLLRRTLAVRARARARSCRICVHYL